MIIASNLVEYHARLELEKGKPIEGRVFDR